MSSKIQILIHLEATTQAIFGSNQNSGQTQSISKSGGGSNTQDSVTNTMQNLNDSPHNSNTIQVNQQLNTNHNDDTSKSNLDLQQLTKITQSDRFTQQVQNSLDSTNTFTKDHVLQNLH